MQALTTAPTLAWQVCKLSGKENVFHRGPARCFDEEHAAYEAIVGGRIVKGDVVVVRCARDAWRPMARLMARPMARPAG